MAFVNEEQRKFEFNNEKEMNDVGPGEYLPISEFKMLKQNTAPFESTSRKLAFKANNNPGPGAYDIEKGIKVKHVEKLLLINKLDSFSHKKAHSNDNSKDIEYHQVNMKVQYNYERLGFSIKEKRFKVNPIKQLSEVKINKSNEIKQFQLKDKKTKKNSHKISKGSLNKYFDKIPSIPQKNSCGFIIKDFNHFIQRDNPEKFIYFSGINGDSVGPGSYNIDIPDEWHRTGTNWSKMKSPRMNKIVKHSPQGFLNDNHINIHDYDSKEKDDSILLSKGAFNISMIALKNLMRRNLEVKAKQSQGQTKSYSYICNHTGPGPGYYYDVNLHSAFQKSIPYEDGVIFGSKRERFNEALFNYGSSFYAPGPASYFNNTQSKRSSLLSSFRPRLSKENCQNAFNSNSSRFNATTKSSSTSPGPGSYDSQASLSKTSTAFYAHQKRFSETIKEMENKKKIPGPGSYLNPSSSFKGNDSGEELNFKRTGEQFKKRCNKTFRSPKPKNDFSASVGQYNVDYSSSIEYVNIKKCLNNQNEVAFNSSCPKKKNDLGQNDIGPGSYFNHSLVNFHQRLVPFNYSTSRIPEVKKSKSVIDLFDYNRYEDNNSNGPAWNKRTYNIKYLS